MILKFLEQNTSVLSCIHVFIIMQKVSIVNFKKIIHGSAPLEE